MNLVLLMMIEAAFFFKCREQKYGSIPTQFLDYVEALLFVFAVQMGLTRFENECSIQWNKLSKQAVESKFGYWLSVDFFHILHINNFIEMHP